MQTIKIHNFLHTSLSSVLHIRSRVSLAFVFLRAHNRFATFGHPPIARFNIISRTPFQYPSAEGWHLRKAETSSSTLLPNFPAAVLFSIFSKRPGFVVSPSKREKLYPSSRNSTILSAQDTFYRSLLSGDGCPTFLWRVWCI